MRDHLLVFINGRSQRIDGDGAFVCLSDYLRLECGLCGTKVVCSEGDCGACSVLVGRLDDGRLRYEIVDSCIQFMYQLDCVHVVTVEGLYGNDTLNAVQDAFVRHHGSQCGFCTPGFVMTMTGMVEDARHDAGPTMALDTRTLRSGLVGNLCRCTGYVQIIEACEDIRPDTMVPLEEHFDEPAVVAALSRHAGDAVRIEGERGGRRRVVDMPTELGAAIRFRSEHRDALVVSGATDVGVQTNKRRLDPDRILCLARLPDLDDVTVDGGVLVTGSRATWSQIERAVEDVVPEFHGILTTFGARQIRNVATIGGNLANASPIADSLPFLHVMEATVELTGAAGKRRVNINDFYRGYKDIDIEPDELITRIHTPLPGPRQILKLYRVSRRRDLDIATFTAALLLESLDDVIVEARLAYGGVGPVVLRLPRTETFLTGRPFLETIFREAGLIARDEISPITDVRGSDTYRRQLAENIPLKFFHDCTAAGSRSAALAGDRR